jgi:hypothetical protein
MPVDSVSERFLVENDAEKSLEFVQAFFVGQEILERRLLL